MRQITIGFSILALLFAIAEPALAGKPGVPGRRVGGGTRWTQPKPNLSATTQTRFNAMAFASRNNLPISLKLKALYS